LTDRVAAELERLFQASVYQGDDALVFGHPQLGTPLDASKLLKRFKDALKAAEVRPVRWHDLRHTFAARCAGAPMRTLMEWMGHRDFKTTLIYADYAPSEHEAELVERAFESGHQFGHQSGQNSDDLTTPKAA
jgi:integrase